jgi:hypothetical protein
MRKRMMKPSVLLRITWLMMMSEDAGVMSSLHDMKIGIGVLFHGSREQEREDMKDRKLYRYQPCVCPGCAKRFRSVGVLIEHQDAMGCGLIPF